AAQAEPATGDQAAGAEDAVAPASRQQLKRQWQSVAPELASLRSQIADLQSQIQALKIPTAPVLSENTRVDRPSTNLRIRGGFTNKGKELFAHVPSFLGSI